jgi:hypothetical protein
MKVACILVLFAANLCVIAGCGNEVPAGRTPQLAFDTFRSAIKDKDYKTAFVQTTPESQESLLAIAAAVAPMAAKSTDDQARKTAQKIQAILDRYGFPQITLNTADQAASLKSQIESMKHKPACLGEIFHVIDAEAKNDKYFYIDLEKFSDGKISNVAIDGEVATATVDNVAGKSGRRTESIKFRSSNGLWLIDLSETLRGK